jgi:hypothetical protein
VIDRHLITLAIALQDVDDDVPKLQAWGRIAGQFWQRTDGCSLVAPAPALARSKLDTW